MHTLARAMGNVLRLNLVIACGFVFAAPPVMATPAPTAHAAVWEEWQPLAKAYIARRRVPDRMALPMGQRRSPETQSRTLHVPRVASRSVGVRPSSLWLYTGAPGLYAVGVRELSAQTGVGAAQLLRAASSGYLALLNGGENVSWYYDQAHGRVLFAGEGYETFYAEGNAYQLQQTKTSDPQRMSERTNTTGIGRRNSRGQVATGLETPFRETLHVEQEGDMMYFLWLYPDDPNARYWFWDYLYGSEKPQIQVSLRVPSPAPDGTARVRIKLDGFTDLYPGDDHRVFANLNGQDIGSVLTWDGLTPAELVADFDQALLNAGGDNVLTLHSLYNETQPLPGEFLESIEVEYDRLPVAENGQIWMRDVAAGTQKVSGFTGSDIVVIESPVHHAMLRRDINVYADGNGRWAVAFQARPGSDYLVADTGALLTPALDAREQANLIWPGNRADYLIIAPRDFSETAQALAEYRQSSHRSVKIAWLDDIYKAFSFGRTDPSAIGRFMNQVQATWATAPSVVTLVGKGSLDRKNRMGYGDNFLPVVMTSNPWALAPSDARLLGVDDGVTPFAYGRLPITNDAEGLGYMDKLLTHESRSGAANAKRAVVAADNPDDGGSFYADADQLAAQLAGLGFAPVTKLYHPAQDVRVGLVESETWESRFISYSGHGSETQIGDYVEMFLTAADAANLTNASYPVFAALTCASGSDALPGTRSLAGALVLNPQGGAIAALAPSGASLNADAHTLANAFVDRLYGPSATVVVGAALVEAKQQTSGQVADFMAPIYSVIGDPAADAW